MADLEELAPCEQEPVSTPPYDSWTTPQGDVAALFYRTADGFLIRFPEQADFLIGRDPDHVICRPALKASSKVGATLYYNSILPLLANHTGHLNLHGSAVCVGRKAVGFLGVSGCGKTTLAAAFAQTGDPFLTEDVLALEPVGPDFLVRPSRPVLRLFQDSALFLRYDAADCAVLERGLKAELPVGQDLPFQDQPIRLGGLYVLGQGQCSEVVIHHLEPAQALARLIQHSFILDVEDKERLRGHFDRLGKLVDAVSCFELDYPRQFEQLPQVLEAVRAHSASTGGASGSE